MARYVTKVRTQRSQEAAFEYMADLRNFADWDPGVKRVVQVVGDGAGAGSEYDVTVTGTTMRYRTEEFHPNTQLVARSKTRLLSATDTITVRGDGGASVVTYDAELTLNGVLRVGDPLLGLLFKRIGDRAAAGLRRALDGTDAS
jgi:carbon monoxide dehydrogenase subunit G